MKPSEIILGLIAVFVLAGVSVLALRHLWRSRHARSRDDDPALWI